MILALMPKGVEHFARFVTYRDMETVILALMPKGVEHLKWADSWEPVKK